MSELYNIEGWRDNISVFLTQSAAGWNQAPCASIQIYKAT